MEKKIHFKFIISPLRNLKDQRVLCASNKKYKIKNTRLETTHFVGC